MKFSRQTTLRSDVTVTGVGVHSGKIVNLTLRPAGIDSGFIFVRTGLDGEDREVKATRESVTATSFATVLGDDAGSLVSTTEHVLAALRGMGVDNAVIEVDGPEVPIMDGSAEAFADAIDQAGVVQQAAPVAAFDAVAARDLGVEPIGRQQAVENRVIGRLVLLRRGGRGRDERERCGEQEASSVHAPRARPVPRSSSGCTSSTRASVIASQATIGEKSSPPGEGRIRCSGRSSGSVSW